MEKKSGTFLPIASLPSKYYIGSFGKEAREFVDILKKAGQSYWQILPLNYLGRSVSPYSALSIKAGNPYLIDLEELVNDGLLTTYDLPQGKYRPKVFYRKAKTLKDKLLRKAFAAFKENDAYVRFCNDNAWVTSFATFLVLKEKYRKNWASWSQKYRDKDEEALKIFAAEHRKEINYHIFVQYIFFRQFNALRAYVNKNGLKFIGDTPIYVDFASFDVWNNRKSFLLDASLRPKFVSGVGPDYFSKTGQLWGHPLYDFASERERNYPYFRDKINFLGKMFAALRLDHFRAFDSYYAIPYTEKDARKGTWRKGEGMKLLRVLIEESPDLELFAEDLGDIPPSVSSLLKEARIPGTKVFQFAFDGNPNNPFLPENYSFNSVAYLGTHDNETTFRWYASLNDETKARVREYLNVANDEDIVDAALQKVYESAAFLTIATPQDIAFKKNEKRFNTPASTRDNWTYSINFAHIDWNKLQRITRESGRSE